MKPQILNEIQVCFVMKMKKSIFWSTIFNFWIFSHCNITLNIYNDDDNNFEITECTIKIAKQMKLNKSFTDVFLINTNEQMIKALHNELQGFRFVSRTSKLFDSFQSDACIIMCKNYYDLEESLKIIIKEIYWNPRGKFVIIIERLTEKLQKIADLLIKNNMFNTTMVGKVVDDFEIYAFDTQLDSCNRPQTLEFVSNCIGYDDKTSTFRVKSPSNMKNCHAKLISVDAMPFINFKDPDQLGVEQYLLDLIQQHGGITIELVKYPIQGKQGKFIESNFSYVGMIEQIEAHKVEGGIGGFSLVVHRIRLLENTYPHLQDNVNFYTLRVGFLPMWQAVYVQLSLITKLLILMFFMIFWLAIVKLAIFSNKRDILRDFLIVYGFFLNNLNVANMKTGTPHRIIVLSLAIFVMWISCTIQASLLSQQTYPMRGHQLTDQDEIIKTYEPVMILQYAIRRDNMSQWSRVCETFQDCFQELLKNRDKKLYTGANNLVFKNLRYQLVDDEDTLQLYKSTAVIGIIHSTVYFRRGSTLTPIFSKLISPILRAGLLDHHLDILAYRNQFKRTYTEHKSQVAYNMGDLNEAFIPLVVGYCLSFSIFICEIVFKKILKNYAKER